MRMQLYSPERGRPLPRPTLVAVIWSRPRAGERLARLNDCLLSLEGEWWRASQRSPRPRGLVIATNLPATLANEAVVAEGLVSARDVRELVVLSEVELGEAIDAHPVVRLRMPALLGVRDVEELIDDDVRSRSTLDHDAAVQLARVFVATRPHLRAVDVLERHRFAVLTGPPEMGKTAIARMIALARAAEGWEAHECARPDELWKRFDRDRPQVFIADDAFGSTEYRPEAAERWARDLDRILRAMDERHWLLWTSRPAPLRAGLHRVNRERGAERFPSPAEVQVDASDLDAAEKALILFRHAKAARLDREAVSFVQMRGPEIVSHRHFTPERIRRFVAGPLRSLAHVKSALALDKAVEAALTAPTEAMASSFAALEPAHRALLLALLDSPPGPVSERELAAAMRRHADEGLPRAPAELIDRLTDHFVRVLP